MQTQTMNARRSVLRHLCMPQRYHLRIEAALDNVAVVIIASLTGDECQVAHLDALRINQITLNYISSDHTRLVNAEPPEGERVHPLETHMDQFCNASRIALPHEYFL